MDKYKLKYTRLQNEILRLLCVKAGEKINQRKIAGLLSVSPTAIAKALPLLEKEKLINLEKSKTINLVLIELNLENNKAIQIKKLENLKQVFDSGLSEHLKDLFAGTTIILFGSYSRGEDIQDSDIDIAIIGTNEKEVPLKKYESFLEREIIINFYPSFNKIHTHLKNNILNGIILSGSVEL